MKTIVSSLEALQLAVDALLPGTCLLLVLKLDQRCAIQSVVRKDHLPAISRLLAESETAHITCIVTGTIQAALATRLALNRLERRYTLSNAKHAYTNDVDSVVEEVIRALHVYRPDVTKSNPAPTTEHEASLSQPTALVRLTPATKLECPDSKLGDSVKAMASRFGKLPSDQQIKEPSSGE